VVTAAQTAEELEGETAEGGAEAAEGAEAAAVEE
jgi:hypothetical protein